MNFSNNSEVINEIRKYLMETIDKYSREKTIVNSPIDRTLLYLKLSIILNSIIRDKELREQVLMELNKIFSYREKQETQNRKEIVYESRMDILKTLYGKKKVTVSSIFSRKISTSEILDYIWLRKEGIIRKGKDGKLIIDRRIYSEGFDREKIRRINVSDLIRYMKEIPSRLWFKVIDKGFLNRLENEDFIKLLDSLHGYNPKIDQEMINELKQRLDHGWRPSWYEWRRIGDFIRKTVKRKPIRYMGPYTLYWLDPSSFSRDMQKKVLNDLMILPLQERWKIVSKLSRCRGCEDILRKLDLVSLSTIGNPNRYDEELRNRILLGKSLINYINYALTRDESYLDYSMFFLSKVDQSKIDPRLRPLYRSIVDNDQASLFKYLSRKYPLETIEYLTVKVWDSIRSFEGMDKDLLWRAIELGYRVLKYNLHGMDYLGETRTSYVRGRIAVKKTMYNFARYNYTVVRRYKEKTSRMIALVDVSGSMLKFSTWAVLSLSSILPVVKTTILFTDKTYISRAPRKTSRYVIINYLEKLFVEGFRGYTNISLALRTLNEIAGNNDVAVLFSDLEQTVKDSEPWVEASKFLSLGGRRLVVFVPPYYRSDVAREFMRIGCEVVVVKDPIIIPRLLKRKLGLKARTTYTI